MADPKKIDVCVKSGGRMCCRRTRPLEDRPGFLHHLAQRLPDPQTTVLVAGFQAIGTRGRTLIDGARFLRIHGRDIPVRAAIRRIDALSGHADRNEIGRWLGQMPAPRKTFLVHGEPPAAKGMADFLKESRGWAVHVPRLEETVDLMG